MQDTFKALATVSLVTQARDCILRAITIGEFLPGQRLVEGEIAGRLGISRGPVREAARLLEQRGLLVSLPRRGFFVRAFEEKEIEDLYELRECIEVAAVRAAVSRASKAGLRSLGERHRKIISLTQRGREPELIEAIVAFHRSICVLSGNGRLIRLFDEIAIEVSQILSVLGVAVGDPGRPIEVQGSLLEALEARDSRRAAREMAHFIRHAKAEVMEHYRRRHPLEDGRPTQSPPPRPARGQVRNPANMKMGGQQ